MSAGFIVLNCIRLNELYILTGLVMSMATKIEFGMSLEGDDARAFHEYMENPDDTKAGRELIREALRLTKIDPDSR